MEKLFSLPGPWHNGRERQWGDCMLICLVRTKQAVVYSHYMALPIYLPISLPSTLAGDSSARLTKWTNHNLSLEIIRSTETISATKIHSLPFRAKWIHNHLYMCFYVINCEWPWREEYSWGGQRWCVRECVFIVCVYSLKATIPCQA